MFLASVWRISVSCDTSDSGKWCPCRFCLCAWRRAEPSAARNLSHLKSDGILHSSFSKILWAPSLWLSHKSCFPQSTEPSRSNHCPGWEQRSKRRTFLGWWGNKRWAPHWGFQTSSLSFSCCSFSGGRQLTRHCSIYHPREEFWVWLCSLGIVVDERMVDAFLGWKENSPPSLRILPLASYIVYIYRLSFDFQSAPEICFQGCFCHSVHFPSLQMLMNKHGGHVKHAHASEAVRGHFPSAPASSHTSQLICLSPVTKNSCGWSLGSRFTGGICFGSTCEGGNPFKVKVGRKRENSGSALETL